MVALALAVAISSFRGPAPADEYFGPYKESILEIRNRLMSFERDTDWDLRRHIRGIDNVELAIEDWSAKYPRDPWIPGFSHRLARVYVRAHAGHCRGWHRMIALRGR
jgi:hypothetical protein